MADRKLLFVNADGAYEEHSESGDSIKALSFKTASSELTDVLLTDLVDGGDATAHKHDNYYFQESEFLNSSAGAGDAGKPVVLDADGNIDASMINDGDIDHGSIGGLADDDHTQYSLADGTRDYTGKVSYSSHPSFTTDEEIVDKKYVDDTLASALSGLEWQDSALDYITNNTVAPPTEVTGDRYILSHDGGTPHADYDGASAGDIVEFNGSTWDATTPTTGTFIAADDQTSGVYLWTGAAWTFQGWEQTTASTGLTKVGYDVRLADAALANGIQVSSGAISAVGDSATIGINGSNQLEVIDDGIDDTKIDFGTGANQVNAEDLPIIDSATVFTATNVEDALKELYDSIAEDGVTYNAGTGGVSKGDVLFVSGNDEASVYATITNANYPIGIALATIGAGNPVKVAANDVVVTGVLTGATAGDKYYWNGSALTTTIPTGTGAYVIQAGIAKNATDLHVECKLVKKNA